MGTARTLDTGDYYPHYLVEGDDMTFDDIRKDCPWCKTRWQNIRLINDRTYFTHYCEMVEDYVGWSVDSVPTVVPAPYTNPPGR